jgi:hypothetical protein
MREFYPPPGQPPDGLAAEDFILEPLRVSHVEADFAAVMASREMLRRWGGGKWPADDFTLQGNLEDLAMHEREHEAGEAFTYTVLSPDGRECLGCVYIKPLAVWLAEARISAGELETVGDNEAVLRFWARQDRLDEELDERLLARLLSWIAESWAFRRVLYQANENDSRQVALLAGRGFIARYRAELPGRQGRFILYQPAPAPG